MPPSDEKREKQDRQEKQQQILDAVLERATVDRDFRQQLLTDPRRAIQAAFGVVIPAEFRMKFVERDADVDALVVLPDFRNEQHSDRELTENELETISGGMGHHDARWSNPKHLPGKPGHGHTSY
jgi:hypothetical protein